MEYGETTAEMAMLLAFIFFGAVLSPLLDTVPLEATLGLAAVALGIGRPLALGLVLWRARVSRAARAFLGWFGPRGLNSLLVAGSSRSRCHKPLDQESREMLGIRPLSASPLK